MSKAPLQISFKHSKSFLAFLVKHFLFCFPGTLYFFFIYSEVFDALLIQSQYWEGFENIVKLFHYWSLNHLCFSAHSTFVSQHTPLLLRKVQKMQLCYCNSQKNFTKKCFKLTFVMHFSAFQDFQNEILFQYSKISYNNKVNFCELSDILRVIF